MKAVIDIKDGYTDDFMDWLVDRTKELIVQGLNQKKLDMLNEYVQTLDMGVEVDLNIAFLDILDSITYFKTEQCYHLGINTTVLYRTTTFKLVDIAKFINYGNQEVQGTPIFSDAFHIIATNTDNYYNRYLLEEGVL
jgi:hypothetical protein